MEVQFSQVRLVFNVGSVNAIAVSSNWLYLTGGPHTVVCINLDSPSEVIDILIPLKLVGQAGSIRQIYADTSGSAIVVITSKNEHFFYSHPASNTQRNSRELRHLAKLKGTSTICACFHPTRSHNILLGTRAGNIVEIDVDTSANDTYFKRDLKVAAQIWKSPLKQAVTSLLCVKSSTGLVVFACCGGQVLKWSSKKKLSQKYNTSDFQHLLSNQLDILLIGSKPSQLRISPSKETIAVLLGDDKLAVCRDFQNFDVWNHIETGSDCDFLLVSNYFLIILKNSAPLQVNAVNVFDHSLHSFPVGYASQIKGVASDSNGGTFWAFSDQLLYEIRLENESGGMWKVLASQSRFEEALAIADTREAKSYVLAEFGSYELRKGNYEEAAKKFGQSDMPLEAAALALMGQPYSERNHFLSSLILARLSHTKSKAQQVMLTGWLAELGDMSFLDFKYDWDTDLVCQTLQQRGQFDLLERTLVTIGNFDKAAILLISKGQYKQCLALLREHKHLPSVYNHASVLLNNEPKATVESWMRIGNLDPSKLLHSLIHYSQSYRGPISENQALRYLNHVVAESSTVDVRVFNVVVSILCKSTDSMDPTHGSESKRSSSSELLRFLKAHASKVNDHDYALRMCLQYKHLDSSVYLHTVMNLHEDAVQLCLETEDPALLETAVEIADKHTGNEELRKYLLKEIAHKLIRTQGPQAAVRFIKLLRVDDLLAQFPDFETLNELAPDIVDRLEQTNARLSALDEEINESLDASEVMQREITNFKRRSVLIEPGESCYLCEFPLVTRKFVVFPCQHGFHADCIAKQLLPSHSVTEECVLCSTENIKQINTPLSSVF